MSGKETELQLFNEDEYSDEDGSDSNEQHFLVRDENGKEERIIIQKEDEFFIELEDTRPLLSRPLVKAGLVTLGVGCCVLAVGGIAVGAYWLSSFLGQASGEPISDNSYVSNDSIIELSTGSEHSEVSSISNDSINSVSHHSAISEPYYIPPVPSAYVDCLQFNTQPPGGSFVQSDAYGDFVCLDQVGNQTEIVPCPTVLKDGDTACFSQTHTDDKFGLGYNVNDYKGDYRTRLDISNNGDENGFTLDNPEQFSGNMTSPQTNPDQLGSLQSVTAFFTNPNKRFVAEAAMYEAANTATQAGNPYLSIALLAGSCALRWAAPLVANMFQSSESTASNSFSR